MGGLSGWLAGSAEAPLGSFWKGIDSIVFLTRQAPLRERQGAADIVAFGPSRHRAHPAGSPEGSWRVLGAVLVSRGASCEPLRGLPGASCRLLGASWEPFGGLLGLLSGLLGASWGVLWASWGYVGRLGCHLGGKNSKCGFVFPLWGPSWRRLGALWGHLGGFLGRLGALLGRLRALFGVSWTVLGRSGRLLEPCWAVGSPKRR